jgi:hypothetical protein
MDSTNPSFQHPTRQTGQSQEAFLGHNLSSGMKQCSREVQSAPSAVVPGEVLGRYSATEACGAVRACDGVSIA